MADLSLIEQLNELKPGDHLCCIYESEEQHRAVLAPFISQGLERGEKVLYIVDTHTAEEILGYLGELGIDTENHLEGGQLSVLSADDAYMREGTFDPDGMIRLLEEETEKALSEDYEALRVTGEMTWALKGLPGSDRLIEYEAKLNHFFPGSRCLAVCQYDRSRFGADVLLQVLTTHPFAVIGEEVYDNFYYIPPDEFLGSALPEKTFDQRIRKLKAQKRDQEELEEREERERAILDASLDSISLVKLDGTVLATNEMTASRLGRKAEELIGSNIFDFFPPDVAARRRALIEKAFREGQIIRFEDERQGIYFDNTLYPVFDKKGNVEMLAVFTKDITEHKLAEEELLARKEMWERSFNAVKEGLFIMDEDRNILQYNPAFAEIVGRKQQDLVGLKCYEVVHDVEDPPTDCVTCTALEIDEEVRTEVYEPSLDKYLEMSAGPIPGAGGEPGLVIHLIRDITERKRAEEQLERFAHELQERVKELNCLYGISRIVEKPGLSLQDILLEILEITPPSWQYPEITCARITLRDDVFETEDFRETPWRLARDIIVYGVKAGTVEVCYLEERPQADAGPFLKKEGELLRAVAEHLGRIVERGESEVELKRYREQLEELVGERTRELQDVNIKLQQEISERKQKERELKITAGQLRALSTRMEYILEDERRRIALEVHDKLGQELTGLKMNLSLLQRKIAGEEEFMERIREISELADDIIQTVQEISMELRPSILDDLGLDAALEWRLKSFGETAEVETRFVSTMDSDLIDPDLGTALYRIFQEALTNVARHAAAGRVDVELSGEDGELVLMISDDGKGIKESEKSGIRSLGILGMKERANAFGGRVDISKEENGGTTVKVRIPYARSGESRISREELED